MLSLNGDEEAVDFDASTIELQQKPKPKLRRIKTAKSDKPKSKEDPVTTALRELHGFANIASKTKQSPF